MRPLYNAVSLLVVTGYVDVIQVVLLGKASNCFDDWGSIVGNDFVKSTLVTDDVFKYPFSDSIGIFPSEHVEFGVMDWQTLALDDVLELVGQGHKHRVDIDFAKQWSWCSDSEQYQDFGCLVNLTDMA